MPLNSSYAPFLMAKDLDGDSVGFSVRLFAWQMGTTNYVPVSADADGVLPSGNGPVDASDPARSPDSTRVAFISMADELVTGDNNSAQDTFVKDLPTKSLQLVSARRTASPSSSSRQQRTSRPRTTMPSSAISSTSTSAEPVRSPHAGREQVPGARR